MAQCISVLPEKDAQPNDPENRLSGKSRSRPLRNSKSQIRNTAEFMCEVCSKTFSCQSYLRAHLKSHQDIRPYNCSDCGKAFKRLGNLAEHQKIHSGIRQFCCNTCGKTFTQISSLIVHKRIHSGERPFSCGICPKAFAKVGDLNVHKKIHSNDRQYECSECKQRFLRASTLRVHMRIHTGQKPYKCSICQLQFRTNAEFCRHKKHSAQCHDEENVAVRLSDECLDINDLKLKPNGDLVECDTINGKVFVKCDEPIPIEIRDKDENLLDVQYLQEDTETTKIEIAPNEITLSDIGPSTSVINSVQSDEKHLTTSILVVEPVNAEELPTNYEWVNEVYLDETNAECNNSIVGTVTSQMPSEEHPEKCIILEEIFIETIDEVYKPIPNAQKIGDTVTGRKFICPKCGKMFKKLHHLTAHDRTHTGERPFKCTFPSCDKAFTQISTQKDHLRVHTGQKRKSSELRGHQRKKAATSNNSIKIENPKSFNCTECSQTFLASADLRQHQAVHRDTAKFNCDECGKCFKRMSNLKDHMRTHSGARPYRCKYCVKTYKSVAARVRHERIHTNEKPYACEHCEMRFADHTRWKVHTRRHLNLRLFPCTVCEKSFFLMYNLKEHMLTHTKQKRYACNTCPKRFCSLTAFQTHQRLHTGDEPFSCSICNGKFRNAAQRNRHLKVHQKIEN